MESSLTTSTMTLASTIVRDTTLVATLYQVISPHLQGQWIAVMEGPLTQNLMVLQEC